MDFEKFSKFMQPIFKKCVFIDVRRFTIMKKITALLLALIFVLSLPACSDDDTTGVATFYSDSTLERNEPTSSVDVELSEEQVKRIKRIIKSVRNPTDDAACDRLEFYFDCEIKFSDSEFVYYFSYKYQVVYYDHYFGGISEEDVKYLGELGQSVGMPKGFEVPTDNVKSVSIISSPGGYEYSFSGDDANAVVDYLAGLNVKPYYKVNDYTGMGWTISIEYENGNILNVCRGANKLISVGHGIWYEMTHEEASRLDALLDELGK